METIEDVKAPELTDQAQGTTEQAPEKAQVQPEATVSKTKEGQPILSPEKLPEDASQKDKDYATQMQRYLTKRTMELADVKKKAEAYDQILSSDEFKEYRDWKQGGSRQNNVSPRTPDVDPNEIILQKELDDALIAGDTSRIYQVNKKIVEQQLAKKEQFYAAQLAQFDKAQKSTRDQILLEEFGKLHPDFWEFHETGIAVPVLREFERQGRTLDEAYQEMKRIAGYFGNKTVEKQQAVIQEKKAAVTESPGITQETEFVYVGSVREADRLNMELASQGSAKVARVKPRS